MQHDRGLIVVRGPHVGECVGSREEGRQHAVRRLGRGGHGPREALDAPGRSVRAARLHQPVGVEDHHVPGLEPDLALAVAAVLVQAGGQAPDDGQRRHMAAAAKQRGRVAHQGVGEPAGAGRQARADRRHVLAGQADLLADAAVGQPRELGGGRLRAIEGTDHAQEAAHE
ncbi:hypothetical protein D3C72_778490 [compost metagenome]